MARAWAPWLLLTLAACASAPRKPDAAGPVVDGAEAAVAQAPAAANCIGKYRAAQEDPSTRGDYTAGGLYRPGVSDSTPSYIPDVDCIAEPEIRDEPPSPVGNRTPYSVLGRKYRVLEKPDGYLEQGTASYYGQKFHGRLTSNREVYDMYAFTAAHKTLPLPSFARVTNLDNGKSVVVRVNDRGPFHEGRVVDLSYAAAVKLGIVARGTGRVEVRALTPRDVQGEVSVSAAPSVSTAPALVASPAVEVVEAASPSAMDRLTAQLPAVAASAGAASAVHLQVGSYSRRENAEQAQARLHAAGISATSILPVANAGSTFWRLRVLADDIVADTLSARIAALGLGQPHRVKE